MGLLQVEYVVTQSGEHKQHAESQGQRGATVVAWVAVIATIVVYASVGTPLGEALAGVADAAVQTVKAAIE